MHNNPRSIGYDPNAHSEDDYESFQKRIPTDMISVLVPLKSYKPSDRNQMKTAILRMIKSIGCTFLLKNEHQAIINDEQVNSAKRTQPYAPYAPHAGFAYYPQHTSPAYVQPNQRGYRQHQTVPPSQMYTPHRVGTNQHYHPYGYSHEYPGPAHARPGPAHAVHSIDYQRGEGLLPMTEPRSHASGQTAPEYVTENRSHASGQTAPEQFNAPGRTTSGMYMTAPGLRHRNAPQQRQQDGPTPWFPRFPDVPHMDSLPTVTPHIAIW